MHGQALLAELRRRQGEMLESLAGLVGHESPSAHKDELDSLARVIAARFETLGASARVVANPAGGDHLLLRFEGASPTARPGLVLGHFDTVWPLGTLPERPFRVEDGCAYGPGSYDMKAGIVLAEFAFRAIRALGLAAPRPVVLLLTSDEEVGSPTSRGLIEEHARASAYALVLEPPLAGGRLKTARKGVGRFTLEVTGRPAHAGVEPEKGVSAVGELAHQVLALHGLNDVAAGTMVNVGVVHGGTVANVIAARATAEVDVRARSLAEARRVESALLGLRPVLAGASVSVRGGFNRPPMERTPQVAALFERAQRIGRSLGLELGEGATGGGSDGNFTAALGVPTLDGLGAPGAGAHAENEHVEVAGLPERAALLAALILEL
jgi:glutamate carboxypeptidase